MTLFSTKIVYFIYILFYLYYLLKNTENFLIARYFLRKSSFGAFSEIVGGIRRFCDRMKTETRTRILDSPSNNKGPIIICAKE